MLLHKSVVNDSRVRREASALVEAGHRVSVVELDPHAGGELEGFRRISAAPPAWIKRALLPFRLYRLAFVATFLYRIVQLRPRVVHVHDAAMLLPGLIGARLTGARLVYDSHELATGVPYRDGRFARFVAAIERLAVPRAAVVITVSDGIADRLQELYDLPRRPVVVRNVSGLPAGGADGTLRAALGIGDRPLVLHQGAPAPGRGCEVLVRAMTHVPEGKLVFLGDPEPDYGEHLLRLACALGIAGRVHVHPGVPLEELLARTAEADVGVTLLEDTCENHRLALPNKVFEYLAAGIPVVASDLVELHRLVIDWGVGWTVDSSDPVAVAAALRSAIAHRGDRELRARVQRAGRELRWDREQERLLDVYGRLVAV